MLLNCCCSRSSAALLKQCAHSPDSADPAQVSSEGVSRHHLLRRLDRGCGPLAAGPLLLTSLPGSFYGALSARGIEAFWRRKLYTGTFAAVHLQPFCCTVAGVLIPFIASAGMGWLLGSWSGRKPARPPSGSGSSVPSQQRRVDNHRQGTQGHGPAGDHWVEPAQSGDRDTDRVVDEGPE